MIYDCFTFFNELDLLEVRLNILSPHVDKFVLIESDRTFQGAQKPLHYWNNRERFAAFNDRIVHVFANLAESVPGTDYEDGWRREHASRNAARVGLMNASPDDLIMLSYLDEIPDLRGWDRKTSVWWHHMFYYYVNMQIQQPAEHGGGDFRIKGTVATNVRQFLNDPAIEGLGQKFREWRHYNVDRVIQGDRGGWHFSYLGGTEKIKEKINAFAHAELLSHATTENIERATSERWKEGVDLFNRQIYGFKLAGDDELPEYLVANKDRFKEFWK